MIANLGVIAAGILAQMALWGVIGTIRWLQPAVAWYHVGDPAAVVDNAVDRALIAQPLTNGVNSDKRLY